MFDETTDMTEKAGQLQNLLAAAVKEDTSDIFLIPGMPISFKVHGNIRPVDDNKIFPEEMDLYIKAIYSMAGGRSMKRVTEEGDDDFSFSLKGLSRLADTQFKARALYLIRIEPSDRMPRTERNEIYEIYQRINLI